MPLAFGLPVCTLAEPLRAFQAYEKYIEAYDVGGKWQHWSGEKGLMLDSGFRSLVSQLPQWD